MSVKPIEGLTSATRASPVQYTKRVPEKESVKIEVTTPEKFKYVEPINSAGIKIHFNVITHPCYLRATNYVINTMYMIIPSKSF